MNHPLAKEKSCYDDKWPNLLTILIKVLTEESIRKLEWDTLFSGIHEIILWDDKVGETKMIKSVEEEIKKLVTKTEIRLKEIFDEISVLEVYTKEWDKFARKSIYVSSLFVQLDDRLLASKQPTIRNRMLNMWHRYIFFYYKSNLMRFAMKLINSERIGCTINEYLVSGVRDSLICLYSYEERYLETYRLIFEEPYLETTTTFYRLQASQYLQENDVHKFLEYAEAKLKEEEIRAKRYLEQSSWKTLNSRCVSVLIGDILPTILAEFAPLLKAEDMQKLNLMYRIVNRTANGVEPMLNELKNRIVSSGLDEVKSAIETITQDCVKYVECLLELFRRSSKLVKEAFHDDPRFVTVRDNAFKTIVNDVEVFKIELPTSISARYNRVAPPESKCPQLLARYCNMLLTKTISKRFTGDEIESRLKDVLVILKHVTNKDVFLIYHKSLLSRRLLLNLSTDIEKEQDFVKSLHVVGISTDDVRKLSIMFQDIEVSEEINAQFRSSTNSHTMNIKILNAGAWAQGEGVSVTLPLELENVIPDFEEFYNKGHSGRKLQWHHHMSTGTIAFVNKVGKFDFDVTTFQMAVLFAWNERPHESLSYDDLKLATELPDTELRRTLWSLVAFPKLTRQLLLMEPVGLSPTDFTENTSFRVNQHFAIIRNEKVRRHGKINLIGSLQLSTNRSEKEDHDSIIHLRILRTQEAIIKIMKMRKRLDFSALRTELITVLRNMFVPTIKLIKEQLEWLIERQYLRRDEGDMNTLIYMDWHVIIWEV